MGLTAGLLIAVVLAGFFVYKLNQQLNEQKR